MLVVGIAFFEAVGGWSGIHKYFQKRSQEQLANVFYHGEWSFGEYRDCVSINLKVQQNRPVLDCAGALQSGTDKVFKVEFSGDLTYDEEKPENAVHLWLCRRNNGEPSFSCSAKDSPSTKPQPSPEGEVKPAERQLTDAEIEGLRKRNQCEQRFYDKKISEVDGMSIGAACKQNPNRVP